MSVFAILTLNVGLFPAILKQEPVFGSAVARAHAICDSILSIQPPPDALVFQELWTSEARKVFVERLSDLWKWNALDERRGRWCVGLNSGLAIFSSHEIVHSRIHDFCAFRGDERLARKGVQGAVIRVHGVIPLYVFNTHLQAGTGEIHAFIEKIPLIGKCLNRCMDSRLSTQEISFRQLAEIRALADKLHADAKRAGLFAHTRRPYQFLAGDFNIASTHPDFEQIANIAKATDTFFPQESTYPGTVTARRDDDHRIDYIFSLGKHRPSGSSRVYDTLMNSDHMAVHGVFRIK